MPIGAAALLRVDRAEATATLRFRASDQTRERLVAIVAAESRCRAFLALLMVLCCAIGPALIGAVACSAIGGVLGVVIA